MTNSEIKPENLVSTRMACRETNIPIKLTELLSETRQYSISDLKLKLLDSNKKAIIQH